MRRLATAMPNLDDFELYARGLIALGHHPDWVCRNAAHLRTVMARNPVPFPCPPEPVRVAADRYEEL